MAVKETFAERIERQKRAERERILKHEAASEKWRANRGIDFRNIPKLLPIYAVMLALVGCSYFYARNRTKTMLQERYILRQMALEAELAKNGIDLTQESNTYSGGVHVPQPPEQHDIDPELMLDTKKW